MVEISKEMIEAAKEAYSSHGQTGQLRAIPPSDECMRSVLTAALRHAEPCEPVAWRYRYKGGKWVVQKNKPHWYKVGMTDVEIEPLYSSPTPALGADVEEADFIPCVIVNEDAGISELVIADVPTVTGQEVIVRPLFHMNTKEIVGFQWDTRAILSKIDGGGNG